jgi:hypothetical protein
MNKQVLKKSLKYLRRLAMHETDDSVEIPKTVFPRGNLSEAPPLPSLLRWEISNTSPFVPQTAIATVKRILKRSKTGTRSKKVKSAYAIYPTSMIAIVVPCRPYHRFGPKTESNLAQESHPKANKQP